MKLLALTMGEPGGIGPDITLQAWHYCLQNNGPAFAVFCDPNLLRMRAKALGLSVPIEETTIESAHSLFPRALPIIPLQNKVDAQIGASDVKNASAVIESITRAVEAVQDGKAAAIITNPVQKATLEAAGFSSPGHTEFLSELSFKRTGEKKRAVMMLCCDELKTVPLTVHIPLREVAAAINQEGLIEVTQIVVQALIHKFRIARPRIAIAGLNPHAGEDGTMGDEEVKTISPAIKKLRAQNMDIRGPLPADTLFHTSARATYDAVIAMYHDQALIPIKTIAFDRAVNLTLGLPFIRTSPDHGTALDIAGTGKARPDSLIAALQLAAKLTA
jgi:4-hydroxythreonine-4-phosphate dehydrogenase